MEKQFNNPLEGWTKEQIKSTLKKHTKTELLKLAMQWRAVAGVYENHIQKLKQNDPIEEDVYDNVNQGKSVED